jgi:prepilin-type N-terminal cleavage/methylation domain-containing protein
MRCLSKKTQDARRKTQDQKQGGFTLVESLAATAILAFIGVSVWLVLERCMVSAADTTQKMRAFEIARENMEKLLGADSVEETAEYGMSEQYPDIQWQTTVETFYEPLTSRMWVKAVAAADYTDAAGETKTVELTHWLTDLSEEQTQQLMASKEQQEKQLAEYLIEGEESAAIFAGVSAETIRQWVRQGLPMFNGSYLKPWLELYYSTGGYPTEQQKLDLKQRYPELSTTGPQIPSGSAETPPTSPGQEGETDTGGEESPPAMP